MVENEPAPLRGSFKQNSNVGVTKLMQECTSMLREKMWQDNYARPAPPAVRYRESLTSSQPDNSLEAMGPVLESVLGNLTQEYERRLLQKDGDLKSLEDEITRLKGLLAANEEQLALGSGQRQLEYHVSEEQQQELEELKQLQLVLSQEVSKRENDNENLSREYDRVKRDNMRLEVTNKDFQEKIMANEAMLANYRMVQEENRRLYNQVQDLQGNIRVYCRCAAHPCSRLVVEQKPHPAGQRLRLLSVRGSPLLTPGCRSETTPCGATSASTAGARLTPSHAWLSTAQVSHHAPCC